MQEEDIVALVGLAAMLVLFALIAARDVPTLFRRRRPPSLEHTVRIALSVHKPVSNSTRIARLAAWTIFTQFVPIALTLSNAPTAIRIASVAEIGAALGWIVYLLRSPHVTLRDAD